MNFKCNLSNVLFIDIETVPLIENFGDLSQEAQQLFSDKTSYQRGADTKAAIPPEDFYERAGIWAEFGKVICISVGFFKGGADEESFRLKSFYGDDERTLLLEFKEMLDNRFDKPHQSLCGHNIKEFDLPFLSRRMIIHGIDLPSKLVLFGKKPWEVSHLDTMELWKFGDYKHFTSLKLLAYILEIPSPKEDIDGSQVAKVYYEDKDLDRIVRYCERDTLTVAKVFLKLQGGKY